MSEWTPVKYDGRYEFSAEDTELKLRTDDSLNNATTPVKKAVAL